MSCTYCQTKIRMPTDLDKRTGMCSACRVQKNYLELLARPLQGTKDPIAPRAGRRSGESAKEEFSRILAGVLSPGTRAEDEEVFTFPDVSQLGS